MDIFNIIGFSIVALILILTVKEQRKDIAILLSLCAGTILLVFAVTKLDDIIQMLNLLISNSGISEEFFLIIIKVIGISYIIEFAKNICIDSDQTALGNKLEIAGKVIIVTLSLPLINALITSLSSIV